jgi:iron complex outermembrane receptor protein
LALRVRCFTSFGFKAYPMMTKPILRAVQRPLPRALAALFSAAALPAFAQQANAPQQIDAVVVTASPIARSADQLSTPATVITKRELEQLQGTSLGDTLSTQLGVTNSAFAPGAGRPVIRGQDGPRVQMLENGMGVNDVSRLSPDHRVATETANASQVEILRGPATLLYGSGAIGGLVNVVNTRIPTSVPQQAHGEAGLRVSNNMNERGANAALSGGSGKIAFSLDASDSRTRDYRFPGFAVKDDPSSTTGTMPNSQTRSREAGLGAAWIGDGASIGASVNSIRSRYGVPGEQSELPMKQDKFDARAAFSPGGAISDVVIKLSNNNYEHSEVELPSRETAVTFKSKGTELRAEVTHAPLGGWRGTVVAQASSRNFSALSPGGGIELVEPNKTRATALALVEERDFGSVALDAGVRVEREQVRPQTSSPRSFNLTSASLGGLWRFAPGYNAALTLSSNQRAPQPEELYTNGPHDATATFEIGNPNLARESSRAIDLSLRKTTGPVRGTFSLFTQRFSNYVFAQLQDTDANGVADRVDDDGVLDPTGSLLLQYVQTKARFSGAEFEVMADLPVPGLSARLFGDRVRAALADGSPLPRIAPARLGLALDYTAGPWRTGASATRVFAQTRTASLETETDGYTRIDLNLQWRVSLSGTNSLTLFAQVKNLAGAAIRLHTSVLKDSVPQPARTAVAGIRGVW